MKEQKLLKNTDRKSVKAFLEMSLARLWILGENPEVVLGVADFEEEAAQDEHSEETNIHWHEKQCEG